MATRTTYGELLEGVLPWIVGPAVLLPAAPGFLLCMPGLVLAGLLLIPVIAIAIVVGIAVAIVEGFVALVRRARGRPRRSARVERDAPAHEARRRRPGRELGRAVGRP